MEVSMNVLQSILIGFFAGLMIFAALIMVLIMAVFGPQVVYDFAVNHPILVLLMASSVISSSTAVTRKSK
jgi:hypothetical protein